MNETEASWVATLAQRFETAFPVETPSWRTIGREAEYPVVRADGSAAEVAELWPLLMADGDLVVDRNPAGLIVGMEGKEHGYVLEVGRGTIEVITGPTEDLHLLKSRHEAAMARLVDAADQFGWRVLGHGIQPLTPSAPALMSPKPRYRVLLETVGPAWLWFTLTASDQTHIDIGRSELVSTTNLAGLLSPVVIALCANSGIYEGRDQAVCSGREAGMGTIQAGHHRHGMPAGPLDSAKDLVARTVPQPLLLVREEGVLHPYQGSFLDHLAEMGGAGADGAWPAYLLHEHYTWNSARPRTAHATLELRAACQQPPEEHMVNAALSLAIVEAAPALARYLEDQLGPDPWQTMRAWHQAVIRDGLQAPPPVPGLVAGVLACCAEALKHRGRGEETFLTPLWRRLEQRRCPAHDARERFAAAGAPGLVDLLRWR